MLRVTLLLVALGSVGCLAAERPAVEASSAVASAIAPAAAAMPTVVAPASSVIFLAPSLDARDELSANAAPIGVAACDRYLALVDACPSNATARQGATKKLLEKDGPSWREAARSSTEGRLAVTMACEAAIEGLRQKPCH
jgi:hypothetical protein